MKDDFAGKCSALLSELNELLANPRADEIVLNDWLHFSELPMPSIELIRYIGFRMLAGHGIMIESARMDRLAFAGFLIKTLREESADEREESVSHSLRGLECYRFFNSGKSTVSDPYSHEWLPILWPFLYPKAPSFEKQSVAYEAGQRSISRGLIESMSLRAIFTQDYRRIQSLAVAMKQIRLNESTPPTLENRIKGETLKWFPHLTDRLERNPLKSEMKEFILNYAAATGSGISDHKNEWNRAFRELGYPEDPKGVRMDKDRIAKLALAALSSTK